MADPIVGKFFHSFAPEGTYIDPPTRIVEWQGQVRSKVRDGLYLVRLHNFISGEPGDQLLVPVEKMMDWRFYDSREEWAGWYENVYEPLIERSRFEFKKAGAK